MCHGSRCVYTFATPNGPWTEKKATVMNLSDRSRQKCRGGAHYGSPAWSPLSTATSEAVMPADLSLSDSDTMAVAISSGCSNNFIKPASSSICGMIGSPPATFGQLHSLPSHSNVELTTVALLALSASPHSPM